MRKQIWIVLALLGVAAIVGFISLGQSAKKRGQLTEAYFRALFTPDAPQLRALQHPEWAHGDVVVSLLDASAQSVREYLGEFRGIGQGESIKKVGTDKPWVVRCALDFEKGTADGTLHVKDDKVVAYHVRFPVLPKGWSPNPEDKTYYRERRREILMAYASGEAEQAYGLMAARFREDFTLERFAEDVAGAQEHFGSMKEVKYLSESGSSAPMLIEMYFHIQGEKDDAYVKIRFENGIAHTGLVGIGPATAEEAEAGS